MPQGTVKSFDLATQTGVLMDDTLRLIAIGNEAFAASGLRELRIGQRVRYEVDGDLDGDHRVTNLDIVAM